MAKKNKHVVREMETEEQKKERWAKNEKMAKSFAIQMGVRPKRNLTRKLTQSEKYDY